MLTLSIDIGAISGAWAILDQNNTLIALGDVPHIDGEVQTEQLTATIYGHTTGHDVRSVVELVHSMPAQGVSSSFKFGMAYGSLLAVANRVSNTGAAVKVTPQKWKKSHGLIGTEKIASLELARLKYPNADLRLKRHHGRADAILIGLWLNAQG
jgi:hypothetical protein